MASEEVRPKSQDAAHMYYCAIIAAIVHFTCGIPYGWYPPMSIKLEHDLKMSESQINMLPQVFTAVVLGGYIFGSEMSNRFGRKMTMIYISVPHAVSLVIMCFFESIASVYINRVLSAIAYGGMFTVIPTYISEISTPERRGFLTCICFVMTQSGYLFQYILVPIVSFQLNALICLIIIVCSWLLILTISESPYYLLYNNKCEKATQELLALRGHQPIDRELNDMQESIAHDQQNRGSYLDIFRQPTNRKALMITAYIFFAQQAAGCNLFPIYSQKILKRANFESISVELSGDLYMLSNIVFGLAFSPLLEKFGRKPLVIFSCFFQGLPILFVGLFFYQQTHGGGWFFEQKWLPFVGLITNNAFYSAGLMTVAYMFPSELFPTSVRTRASVISLKLSAIYSLILNSCYAYATDEENGIDFSWIFFAVVAFCAVNTVLCFFLCPETKGLTLDEIQMMLKGVRRENMHIERERDQRELLQEE